MIGPVRCVSKPVDRGKCRLGPGGENESPRRTEFLAADDDGPATGHGGATTYEPAAFAREALAGDIVVPVVGRLFPDTPGDDRPVRAGVGVAGELATRELSGTLHLNATDGPAGWRIDLCPAGPAVPSHAKAGTAVCGTALTFSPG